MDRRTFLSWVGVGWVASCLPVAIAACTSDKTEKNTSSAPADPAPSSDPASSSKGTDKGAGGFQTVGTVAELDKTGYLLNEKFAAGPLLVIRNPSNPKQLSAVNPTCTHKGCTVKWKADEKLFDCPCHDSEFAPDGTVLKGPAKKPLATYAVKLEGNSIAVKAG